MTTYTPLIDQVLSVLPIVLGISGALLVVSIAWRFIQRILNIEQTIVSKPKKSETDAAKLSRQMGLHK